MPGRSGKVSRVELEKQASAVLAEWLEGRSRGSRVPIGLANGALHLLEILRERFPLERTDFTSSRGSQVKGLSGPSGDRIIERFLPGAPSIGTEAGRTSRGTLPAVEVLAQELNELSGISRLSDAQRRRLADGL